MNTTPTTPPPTTPATDPPRSEPPLVKGLPSTRSLVALVTAIAGLVGAIAAFQRTPDEPTAKESYVVLQKAFLEQQIEVDGLKKDVLSMRASFEAYARAKEGDTNVVSVSQDAAPPPGAIPPVEVHVRPTPSVAFSSAPPAASRVVVIPSARAAAPSRPPLPSVSDLESNARKK